MNRKAWISVAIVGVAAAVALAAAFEFRRSDTDLQKKPSPPVKLVLGVNWNATNANIFIANQMGYFHEEGLDVSLQPCPAGRLGQAALLEGKADPAVTAVTPIVLAAFG
jgi:ABC-type nitrate/sulfonate/bicarbonate transport system substrate-binding protein